MPCGPVKFHWYFWGTHCYILRDWKVSQAMNLFHPVNNIFSYFKTGAVNLPKYWWSFTTLHGSTSQDLKFISGSIHHGILLYINSTSSPVRLISSICNLKRINSHRFKRCHKILVSTSIRPPSVNLIVIRHWSRHRCVVSNSRNSWNWVSCPKKRKHKNIHIV